MPRQKLSGFSLIEVMVTVVIIGVLAAVAVPTFTSYIYRSRTSEATAFLAEIRQRQESYRSEFSQYANVAAANPTAAPSGDPHGWMDLVGWQQLGARPDGAVRFQYMTFAGLPGDVVPAGLDNCGDSTAGVDDADFWYVAQASGDLDDDGDTICFEMTSHRDSVWMSNSAGWE